MMYNKLKSIILLLFKKMSIFTYKCKHFWYDVQLGISNIVVWFSTIWKLPDYDYYGIYLVLEKQLSLMEKNFKYCINKRQVYCENLPDSLTQIIECKNILKRLLHARDNWSTNYTQKNKNDDLELLFKIFKNNIENWSD